MRLDAAISDAREIDEAERLCAAMLEVRDDALGERDAAIARAEEAERMCVDMWDRADDWAGPQASSHYRSGISDRLRPMRARVKP
jgi:hypothetical protein